MSTNTDFDDLDTEPFIQIDSGQRPEYPSKGPAAANGGATSQAVPTFSAASGVPTVEFPTAASSVSYPAQLCHGGEMVDASPLSGECLTTGGQSALQQALAVSVGRVGSNPAHDSVLYQFEMIDDRFDDGGEP